MDEYSALLYAHCCHESFKISKLYWIIMMTKDAARSFREKSRIRKPHRNPKFILKEVIQQQKFQMCFEILKDI